MCVCGGGGGGESLKKGGGGFGFVLCSVLIGANIISASVTEDRVSLFLP